MPEKKTYQEFAQAIKTKYPEYKDVDDFELASKMVDKYPDYKDQVDLTVKKKEPTGPTIENGNGTPPGLPSESTISETGKENGAEIPPFPYSQTDQVAEPPKVLPATKFRSFAAEKEYEPSDESVKDVEKLIEEQKPVSQFKQEAKEEKTKLDSLGGEYENTISKLKELKALYNSSEFVDGEEAEFIKNYNSLVDKAGALEAQYNDQASKYALSSTIAKTKEEEQKGNVGGAVFNSLVEGLTSTVEAGEYLTYSIMAYLKPEWAGATTKEEALKNVNETVEKLGVKKTLDDIYKLKSTTPEYISKLKEDNIVAEAGLGAAESIFPMMTPGMSGMFFSGFTGAVKDLEEKYPDLSPEAKMTYGVAQGAVQLALEKLGFTRLLNNTPLISSLTNKFVSQQFKEGVKDLSSKKAFDLASKIVKSYAAEFETGALQYIGEEGIKQTVDMLQGEDKFQIKDAKEFLANTLEAGNLEGLGGAMMGTVLNAPSLMKGKSNTEEVNQLNTDIEKLVEKIEDPNISEEEKVGLKNEATSKIKKVMGLAYKDKNEFAGFSKEEVEAAEGAVLDEYMKNSRIIKDVAKKQRLTKQLDALKEQSLKVDDAFKGNIDQKIKQVEGQLEEVNNSLKNKIEKANETRSKVPATEAPAELRETSPINRSATAETKKTTLEAEQLKETPKFAEYATENTIPEPVSQGEYGKISQSDSRNEKVAGELRGRIEEAQGDEGVGKDTRAQDNQIAYDYAKKTNTWIDDLYSLGKPFTSGTEHTNAFDPEKQKVYKSNNLINTQSLNNFLDKIRLHNYFFPNTAYTFEGFTGIKDTGRGKPYVEPVYSQDFIKDAEYATDKDIDGYMNKLGFEKTGDYKYKRGDVEVWDVRPRNVLKDKQGNIYVIDAEFKTVKKTKDAVQKQSTKGVLPRQQEETGETRGEREGVGQGQQRKETAQQGQEEISAIPEAQKEGQTTKTGDYEKGKIRQRSPLQSSGEVSGQVGGEKPGSSGSSSRNQEVRGKENEPNGPGGKAPQEVAAEAPLKGEQPAKAGVKKAYVEPKRRELGLEDIEKGKVTDEELIQEADRIFKEDPEYVKARIQEIADGANVNGLDQVLVSKYLADLDAKNKKNPTAETVNEFDRVSRISTMLMGTEVARSLSFRRVMFNIEESLSNALVQRKKSLGVDTLSKEEMSEVEKLWGEVNRLKEQVEQLKKENEEQYRRALAEAELKQAKKSKKYTKKAAERVDAFQKKFGSKNMKIPFKDENGNDIEVDLIANGFTQQRIVDIVSKVIMAGGRIADAIVDIRRELGEKEFFKKLSKTSQDNLVEKLRQNIERSFSEFTEEERAQLSEGLNSENAKIIKKLVKEQTDNGIYDLDKITESVEGIVGLDNITRSDIVDVIGGRYNEKVALSEHQRLLSELRQEAKALSELEQLMGEKVDIETLPRDTRQRIKELKDRIREFKTEEIEQSKIKAAIRRNENQIKKITEKINNKDYTKEVREPLKNRESLLKKFPKERERLLDSMAELNDKRWEFQELYIKDELARRGSGKKVWDLVKKTVNTISKAKAGIDLSAAGVHGAWLALSHPRLWARSLGKSIKGMSEKEYNRQLAQLQANEEVWHIAKGARLDIFDIQSLKEQEVEGLLLRSWFDKHVTKGGRVIDIGKYSFRPFERAFVSMGNNMRMELFAKNIQPLLEQGKTFESHPEDFKRVAMVVNSITGRGKVHSTIFNNDLINTVVWAPRLFKSALDMIGVADAFSIGRGAETGYYRAAAKTKEARDLAIKTAASGVVNGALLMSASALFLGADVDDDPQSPTFGWIKFKDGHSWNVFGRFSSTASKILILARGEMYIDGKKVEVDRNEKFLKILRGKAAPTVSLALDIYTGETYMGEEAKVTTTLGNAVTPISLANIAEEVRFMTPGSVLSIPANFVGLPVYTKASYEETMRAVRIYQARKRMIEYLKKGY
jgi:hypothetical protein